MRFIKQSERSCPEASLIFLDWSVRESFHILHYLARQTLPRDRFEVIVIEYYSRVSPAISTYEDQVDTWLLLEMPDDTHYHKHLMYNAGIVLSRGRVVVISDSDAMVRETFLERILRAFQHDNQLVLHLDQFRNHRRDFYPFNFPTFAEVTGMGCLNNAAGKTAGVSDTTDPLHTRNYGACMCALRSDLLAIGGADEHIDYLGHICGPYEMTFRLMSYGRSEIWLDDEFTYHTWHPGQAGEGNYLGPHDGKHLSSRALQVRRTKRVFPYVENPLMRILRLKGDYIGSAPPLALLSQLISEDIFKAWSMSEIGARKTSLMMRLLSSGDFLMNPKLAATLVKMVTRQFWIKLTRVPRQVSNPKVLLKKIIGVYSFLRIACRHNLYVMQLARQVFDELRQQGIQSVSLYGTGEIAEMLYSLAGEVPMKITCFYDDFGNRKFLEFDVLPIEEGAADEGKIVIASVINVEEKIARLMRSGVDRERIAVLQ